MASLSSEERPDEVHCLWALCSHPCCWETERRIANGVHRRAVRVPVKRHANTEARPVKSLNLFFICDVDIRNALVSAEKLLSLTVVDVSEWTGMGMRTVSSDQTYLSRIRMAVRPRKDRMPTPRSKPCSTDSSFPEITSSPIKSHRRERSIRAKSQSDKTIHISPLIDSPLAAESLVLWVANPRYIPQCIKSSNPPLCAVKELICLPAGQKHNTTHAVPLSQNHKETTKRVRFQLTCSPLTLHPSPRAESGDVSPGQEVLEGTGDASAAMDEHELLRDLSEYWVKIKPVVFHSIEEKRVRTTSRDAVASVYKLDNKTGEEKVDWDSLRGQSYLWKRHNILHDVISPPGGVRGAQETVGPSPVSKVSSNRTRHRPQCATPSSSPCEKTHPVSHNTHTHHGRTGSELDMTIWSSSAISEHRMLETDENPEGDGISKGAVTPLNSEFYDQHSTHELYSDTHGRVKEISNLSPDSSTGLRILSGVMEPWGRRSSSEHLCTSITSLSYLSHTHTHTHTHSNC